MLGVSESYQNYQKGAASNQLTNFEKEGEVLPSNAVRNFVLCRLCLELQLTPRMHCLWVKTTAIIMVLRYYLLSLGRAVLRIRIRIRIHTRIHMFLGLPDPDPLVRGVDPDPDFYHHAKIVRKTLIPTIL